MGGEELRRGLDELARDFERLAVPPHGRYVGRPAVADARGVVSVPPPPADPLPKVLLGLGAGIALGAVVLTAARAGRR
jgi:hypothetical protein